MPPQAHKCLKPFLHSPPEATRGNERNGHLGTEIITKNRYMLARCRRAVSSRRSDRVHCCRPTNSAKANRARVAISSTLTTTMAGADAGVAAGHGASADFCMPSTSGAQAVTELCYPFVPLSLSLTLLQLRQLYDELIFSNNCLIWLKNM